MTDPGPPQAPNPQGKRILVVDDDEGTRDLLTAILTREGFRVETAGDGVAAVTAVESSPPDLVILDLMLPRQGGYEVLRRMQAGEASGTPVIIVTGRFMDRTTTDMLRRETNVREVLQKPIQHAALAMMVHRILGTEASK